MIMNKKLNFKKVELNTAWPEFEAFINSFPAAAGSFSYHYHYKGGLKFLINPRTAFKNTDSQTLNFKNRILVFKSPDSFMNLSETEAVLLKGLFNYIAIENAADINNFSPRDILKLIKTALTYNFKKIRIYINCDSIISAKNSEHLILESVYKFQNSIIKKNTDGARISLSFSAPSIISTIQFNETLASKFPDLIPLLHIQTSRGLNTAEAALLFYLKYQSRRLKNCSIAPNFNETAAIFEESFYLDTLEILRSLEFENIPGIFFISCPTCSRCKIDVIGCANNIYRRLRYVEHNLKVAIMGCEVNGPGEASHADIGAAGSLERAVIFERGKIVERITPEKLEEKLMEKIKEYVAQKKNARN